MDESAIRDVLNVERAEVLARIRAMQADLDAIVAASANANTDDEHDPEGSTIAYERAQVAALLARAQSKFRILIVPWPGSQRGLFGLRAMSFRILAERLAALPAGRTCFDCANNATWK